MVWKWSSMNLFIVLQKKILNCLQKKKKNWIAEEFLKTTYKSVAHAICTMFKVNLLAFVHMMFFLFEILRILLTYKLSVWMWECAINIKKCEINNHHALETF